VVKFLILLFQLFILIFLTAYLTTNSFTITFDINELQYIFSSNLLLFFIVSIILFAFIFQFFYFKSLFNLQKYFLLKNNTKLKKGYGYFVEAMIAIANKDKKNAVIANNKMKKLIKDDKGLSLLLNAEIFKIEKKYQELSLLHEEMIKNKSTQALGYKGLMEANINRQDYHHAYIYGEKLFQLNPFIDKLYITLVSIIAKTRNWNQLIYISKEAYNKKIIDQKLFNQNTGIAYYEISKIKTQSEPEESLNLVLKAINLNGSFPPFIKLYLEILLIINDTSKIKKIIKKYWNSNPNSSLRRMISIFLKENKMADLDNIKFIIKGSYDHKETKKLLVDFAIHNGDWSLAREGVNGLIQVNPDREICEFMAELEIGEFNNIQKRDAWMLRAQNANLDEIWICQITNIPQNNWSSVSDSGHFNSLEWLRPKMLGTNILNDE
jgi:uncharacterized membrane-anchored protein